MMKNNLAKIAKAEKTKFTQPKSSFKMNNLLLFHSYHFSVYSSRKVKKGLKSSSHHYIKQSGTKQFSANK